MKKIVLVLSMVALCYTTFCQKNSKLITIKLENASLVEFATKIEGIAPIKLYYDSSKTAGIRINIDLINESLDKVLAAAFKGSNLKYSFDKEGHVFITEKYQVFTYLAKDFYSEEERKQQVNVFLVDDEVVDLPAGKKNDDKKPTEDKIYIIGDKKTDNKPAATISGYIRNAKTGEAIINGSVYVDKIQRGTYTDQYGYFSLSLPKGNYILNVQSLNMEDIRIQIQVNGDGKLSLEMADAVAKLKDVIVSSQKTINITRVQMGLEKLNIANIKKVPAAFGEADVIKAILTLPGVKTVGEASAGFNVRGGSTDQNLVLLNEGTIFNPSHFFGMFSAFNPEIIKDVELYKSSIPAKLGGRLSSVLNITTREGNKKQFSGVAGIGLITSRLHIEGPLKKDKTSFILGGRTTYANWLLKLLPNPYDQSKASFADINVGVSHSVNERNQVFISAYYSKDKFNLASDTTYAYSNRSMSIKWKHTFSNRVTAFLTAASDRYNYEVLSTSNKVNAYKLQFNINQQTLRIDFNHFLNSKHSLDYGLSTIYYKLNPGSFTPANASSLVIPDIVPNEQALESSLYLEDRFNISKKLSLNTGFRYSVFNYMGPRQINQYPAGVPKTESNIIGNVHYPRGIIQTYHAPEFRLALRYAFDNSFSVKAGFNSSRQYIHMLSNTTSIAPTDTWKLSDPHIKPQRGYQASLGFYKNLHSNTIELSAEVYYKIIASYLDYKPGAKLLLNHHIETDVISTKGKAYGLELMAKKSGKFNGWISYTFSRILLKMDDPTIGEIVNGGKYYPANYDKPHDLNLLGNIKFNHRLNLSMSIAYSTGRPITLPIGKYFYAGSERVLYSERNAYRIPDYFRSDLSLNIEGNHKVKQKAHNSWTIGIYNITGRRNPYSVYFVSENGTIQGYRLSIFGSILPFINYNIRF